MPADVATPPAPSVAGGRLSSQGHVTHVTPHATPAPVAPSRSRAAPTGSSTGRPAKRPKTQLNSLVANRKAVINNDFFSFPRIDGAFKPAGDEFSDSYFAKWETWWQRQLSCRFRNTRNALSTVDQIASVGRGRRSVASADTAPDGEASLALTSDCRRLSRCHFEDVLRKLG